MPPGPANWASSPTLAFTATSGQWGKRDAGACRTGRRRIRKPGTGMERTGDTAHLATRPLFRLLFAMSTVSFVVSSLGCSTDGTRRTRQNWILGRMFASFLPKRYPQRLEERFASGPANFDVFDVVLSDASLGDSVACAKHSIEPCARKKTRRLDSLAPASAECSAIDALSDPAARVR
jgi:hypothetical protein